MRNPFQYMYSVIYLNYADMAVILNPVALLLNFAYNFWQNV